MKLFLRSVELDGGFDSTRAIEGVGVPDLFEGMKIQAFLVLDYESHVQG